MKMSFGKLRELVMDREVWHAADHEVAESDMTEWLNWTEQPKVFLIYLSVNGKQTSSTEHTHSPNNQKLSQGIWKQKFDDDTQN